MQPRRATALACAKVNLSLDVGPLRPDGFHDIVSVMQTIGLADTIVIETTDRGDVEVTCDASAIPEWRNHIPTDQQNTAFRAAEAVLLRAGVPIGLRIHITKRIPVEAGLGGGSSDAAAVLRAAAALVAWKPDPDALTAAAAEIGSDVPFFLLGGTALVRGRGEIIAPVPSSPPLPVVIAQPNCGVSTRDAYDALDRGGGRRRSDTEAVCDALSSGKVSALRDALGNHFETVISNLAPAVLDLMEDMARAGASPVRLCGSGSAVFGVADTQEDARAIADGLRTAYPFAVASQFVGSTAALAMVLS
ncbi:MAG: 4-(cytidine 5'-diphospho)-2-C-methyl-D-erythritol kinase [Chthonomonadales bacterium]|nr:4-(cytidine 5'-diphospho)-2-C-methyl-D-erythritol kinase [Chthonomonadales bacterium]